MNYVFTDVIFADILLFDLLQTAVCILCHADCSSRKKFTSWLMKTTGLYTVI